MTSPLSSAPSRLPPSIELSTGAAISCHPSAVTNWRQSLTDRFWAWDRLLGGQRRPTRIQKWVARHPIGTGFCAAAPFTLFFLLLSREEEPNDPLFAVTFGLITGLIFGLTALSERLRQRRLKRLGIWNGS